MAKDTKDSKTLPLIDEPAKRGRPKQSELSRAEQTRLAQKRYRERQKEKMITLSKNISQVKSPEWLENENLELMKENEELKKQLKLKDEILSIRRDTIEQLSTLNEIKIEDEGSRNSFLIEENNRLTKQIASLKDDIKNLKRTIEIIKNEKKPELYALIKKTCKYHYQNPEQPFLITLSGTLGNDMPWEGNNNEYGIGDLDYYVKGHDGKLRKMIVTTHK